jgi:hypothetical protein
MTKQFDSIQDAGSVQLNGVATSLSSFGTILQTIVTEGTDYAKKSMDKRTAFVEKLLGARSLETVIQIQSEYAKTSYTDFAAQATKMGELYSDLAKACFKPIETAITKVQAFKE